MGLMKTAFLVLVVGLSVRWLLQEEIYEKQVDITLNRQIDLTPNIFWGSWGRILSSGVKKEANRNYNEDGEPSAFWGIDYLRQFNWIKKRVFHTWEFVAKDLIISFQMVHLSYLGNYLKIDVTNYKDETLDHYSFPIPEDVYGEPNYGDMNKWDQDISMKHDTWELKVKDSSYEDQYRKEFSFTDSKTGIEGKFTVKREKYLYAGHYALMPAQHDDWTWWHASRMFGIKATGNFKHKGAEFTLNQMNHGRFNYVHMGGMSDFKSGIITGVISSLTNERRKLNMFTVTGMSGTLERNRAETDGLCIDEVMNVMEPMSFEFDRQDLMKPWTVETWNVELYKKQSGSLTFTPFKVSTDKTDYFVVKSEFNRVAGFWDGYVVDKDEKKYEIKRAQGYITLNYVQA